MRQDRSAVTYSLRLIGLTLACFATAKFGTALATAYGTLPPLWVTAGLAMGAFTLWGSHLWPALMVGAFWANLEIGRSFWVAAGLAGGNTLGALLGAHLLRQWEVRGELSRPRDGVMMMAASALAALVASVAGVVALTTAGHFQWQYFLSICTLRWLGHFVGAMLLASLFLAWLGRPAPAVTPARKDESLALLALVAAVTALAFRSDGIWTWLGVGHLSPALFVVPALVWAALRLPPRGAILALAIMSALAIWFTIGGYGPFTHNPMVDDLLELQLMLATVGGTLLILVGAVAERDRVTVELAAAKARADEANLAKSRFVAAIRHDMGQPLQAAELFLATLRGHQPDENSRGLVDRCMGSLRAMTAALGALNDITAVECGLIQPAFTTFPVAELLGQLAAESRVQAAQRGLLFRYVPTSLRVTTDRQLLGRLLRNLLANALRYTRKGRVLLGCRVVREGVRIEVWDTGPGIPEDEQEVIFEAFHRGSSAARHALSESDTGLGLGLATVRQLTVLLGLQLSVHSVVGEGSVFAVVVPTLRVEPVKRSAA